MDKILLRYTEYSEPHKPLTNNDYKRVFGKKRKADDNEGPDSPDLPEQLKEEESNQSTKVVSPVIETIHPLSRSESMTNASLNYETLTPRTVATLNTFVSGKASATPTATFYSPQFYPLSPMKSPSFAPFAFANFPGTNTTNNSNGNSLDSNTEDAGDDEFGFSSEDGAKKTKRRNLRVAIPEKSFPLPITRFQSSTPTSVPTPSQQTPSSIKQEMSITPNTFYYPIPLTPSMPSSLGILEPTLGISTPASGFSQTWGSWMQTPKQSGFLSLSPFSMESGYSGSSDNLIKTLPTPSQLTPNVDAALSFIGTPPSKTPPTPSNNGIKKTVSSTSIANEDIASATQNVKENQLVNLGSNLNSSKDSKLDNKEGQTSAT